MKRGLKFEAVYQHPIEKVWQVITDPKAIEQWLMPNDSEPRVGHKFQFKSKPQPGWDGNTYYEVLECHPPRRLVYTWKGGPIDTVLTIEPESVAGGTRLKLAHTGFKGMRALMVAMIMGSDGRASSTSTFPPCSTAWIAPAPAWAPVHGPKECANRLTLST
ncbi:MAG: SRPBCC family protein [Candidatus Acidiferrales bacterium]